MTLILAPTAAAVGSPVEPTTTPVTAPAADDPRTDSQADVPADPADDLADDQLGDVATPGAAPLPGDVATPGSAPMPGGVPGFQDGGASNAALRPVDKVYPALPPPGRLVHGEPVNRALPVLGR
ncbi:hypothetical protein ACFV1L_08750 [Kitasatospora sp. NPDC059646]|uniref:hypothetical protein n=1 Tax=Kitasatospora sp. NPDC059646 TaxID=3346893 RepID=UPI003687771B